MPQEIWLPVKGFEENYEVSSCGNVRSKERSYKQRHPVNVKYTLEYKLPGKLLKLGTDKWRRKHVLLSRNSRVKMKRVHQLVAEAFLGYRCKGTSKGLVVDHIDNNPSNNRLDNLQIIDQRLNCSRSKKRDLPTGVIKRKRKTPYAAYAKINGRNTYIGSFHTAEEASEAYQCKIKGTKP